MYAYLFGFSFMKSIIPYVTKHVLTTLESEEFLYISYIVDILLISVIITYYFCADNKKFMKKSSKTLQRLKKLSFTQIGCIMLISIIGIVSTFMIFELNNNHNPLVIFILTKVIPVVIIVAGSFFILKESFTWTKMLGIALAVSSIYLLAKD